MQTTQLPTTQLGQTGLEITRVGFGAWAIGGGGYDWGWGAQEDDESIAAIHHALELGVNWIDTAAQYGFGHSEQVVGRALAGLGRAPVRVHEGRAARRAGANDDPEPAARLAPARARRKPLAARTRRGGSLPDPLADPGREQIEEGWSALAELKEAGPRPPHRRLQLQRRAAAADPADRAGRDAAAALLAGRARGRGGAAAVRRARAESA